MAVLVDWLDGPCPDLGVPLYEALCLLLAWWLVWLYSGGLLVGNAEGYGGQELDPHRMPELRLY
jgi:hypothetical protein